MKRNAVLASLVTLLVAFSAQAVTYDLKVVFDTDRNAATGCTVTSPAGSFAGVEQVLNTRVDVTGGSATTFGVTRQACAGGIIGSALPVDSSSWPAGLTSTGDLFIETHVTVAELGMASIAPMRIAFFVTNGTLNDAVMASSSGNPLLWPHPGRHHAVSPTPLPPRTITLDGLDSDWAGIPPVAGGGGGTADLRILNGYAFGTMSNLYFAVRLQANHNAPTAVADSYALDTVGGTLNVGAGSGVLANDSDPNSLPLSAVLIAGVQHGTLTFNADGSFTYVNDGSSAPIDTFEYKATNGTLLSNAAQVQIGVGGSGPPPPPTPAFTSPDHATFNSGEFNTFTVTVTPLHPQVTITATFGMPPGVSFVDNGNSTATISGTPPLGSGGVYQFGLKATNVVGSAIQLFTLTVNETATAPVITSANSVNLQAGVPANFLVTTTGLPDPAITRSGALPTGVTFTDNNNGTATIGGTPANGSGGTYPILITATNPVGTATQNFTIIVCNSLTVTNPATTTGTAGAAFSQNFTQSGAVGTGTFTLSSGVLPTGLTLAANGTLSGTPTVTGSFPITVRVTDSLGCTAVGAIYSLIINCQTITVTNPATTTGTAGAAYSQTFTQSGAIGGATFTTASTLPAGLTLSTAGALSGTPTQTGTFPIVVTVTDGNGCTGNGATYNLVINCQTITVTNPATTTGTAGAAYSQTFTQSGAIGGATFTTASTLPTGLTLAANGALSGTPTQTGTFPIVVTVTDGNGCTGNGATYNLVINCQTITVTNPVTNSGTAGAPFSQTFTQTGAIGGASFTTASTLPTGLTLSTAGVLSGTPTQTGTFPIVVTVTDGNGCTGNGATYNLVINCPTITVTNPATTTATVGTAFSQTFTQTGAIGTATFTTASTLPTGLTLSTAGVLSGTPTQNGTFPIVVTVTDSNGCTGNGATYTLVVSCQVITVTNPGVSSGTAGTAFSETFTQTGAIGGATFTTASTLPTGLTLSTAGVLSGTPTQTGTFPIVVTVTDGNGCTGSGATYTLVIGCQVITVNNPVNTAGTANSAFSETFTATNAIGTETFTTASTLPAGLTLATSGTLSGTPTQTGTFPIVVMVTDGNGCTGTGATYTLVIGCQVITVNNPATTTGTVNSAFSQNFTATNAIGTTTFTTASTLPTGLSLSTAGVLSGTPTQTGTFPIVVTATDGNGCTGTGATYNLVINCQVITVNNPANNLGTVNAPFSETFTATNTIGAVTFTTVSTLPTGITLSTAGLLSGIPTQPGTFPIVVTATDANGCTGNGATYSLIIACQTITVNNPATTNSPAGTPLSINFTQTGAIGGATFTTASTLPTGLALATDGTLSGTPTQGGTFPIVVTVTDGNNCTGTNPAYSLTITCPVITVTNPANTTGTVGVAFSETFTQAGGQGTITFTTASTLPTGLALSTAGVLSGTPSQFGTFPIVVTATDQNGCIGTGSTYNLVISCQTITVINPGVNTGTRGTAFSQQFTQTGANGTATFSTVSTLPNGLTLATDGTLSGTPTEDGVFNIIVSVTDSNGCGVSGPTYQLTIACQTINVINPGTTTGVINTPFSQQFTQTGAIGGATFTTASTLPNGLTLATDGTLSGTPTQSGSFPIVVTVTDGGNCTGTSATYNLFICPVVTVTNPGVNTATANSAFTVTFTQSGGTGTITWSETGVLPTGITLDTSTGVLSGTPLQTGSFPITVTATDQNGCSGTGPTYTLTVNCQTITVNNPVNNTGQSGLPFSETFTATNAIGTQTFSTVSTLPTGLLLSTAGVLSGTPTQPGVFNIIVSVTDGNGCGVSGPTYQLTITCPTITVSRTGGGSFPAGTFNTAYNGQSVTATGGTGPYTFAVTAGALPTNLLLATNGTISGTPNVTGTFNFTVTATDAANCTGLQAFTIAINPVANGDSYSNLVNNTQAVVTGGSTTSPATPFVGLTGVITANDLPGAGVTLVAGIFATTMGGSVTTAADGTFIYTPPVTASALASDTFNYTINSDTGGTGTPAQATGTVTLNLAGRVWYVNNSGAAGNGQSQSPFNTLVAAQTPSTAGDIIFVYNGNGTTSGHTAGITLKNNQQLIGEGVALVVNTVTLVPAGTKPLITNSAATSDAVTLADGNTVKGLTVTGATRDGIAGSTHAGFTGDTLTIQNNVASGLHLTSMTGTVTLTNTTFSGNGVGLDVNNGTAIINVDGTNTIGSSAGGRTVSIQNRPLSAGAITIGAAINDSGTGILVNNNLSGTISFTGAVTLNTTTNTAVSLTTNSGSTITFSGSLAITTTTGIGFNATGGGTLNVAGTAATITTGAAANALNLNGIIVGGSGVTFTNLTSTGASTAVALTNVTGLVSINGGTITGGTTGVSLNGASTSLTLSSTTISGPTTGITNGANFGTLTLNSDTISAGAGLQLSNGTLAGTGTTVSTTGNQALGLNTIAITAGTAFSSVSSSGGANGINLVSLSGSALTINAGTLANHTSVGFGVTGGSSNITFAGGITGTGFLVDITGRTGGTITFSTGTLGGAGALAGTGIRIQSSTGTSTFTFSGTQTLGTSGSRMASTAVTLTGNNTNTTFNFSGTLSIFTNAVTAFTATGPTGGTINFSGTDSIDAATGSALVLNGVNLGSGTLSSVTSTGGVNGISLTTVTGGTLTIGGGALSGATGATFLVSGGTVSVTDGGTISQATAGQPVVSVSGGHITGTLTFSGAVTATNGTGLQFDNADGTYNFNSATNALSGGARVDILNNSSGTFSFASGMTITNPGVTAFNVLDSSPSVTYSGAISTNNSRPVSVSRAVAGACGTITFQTGNITASSGSNGIIVNNCNAGTVTFSGPAVTLTTTTNAGVTLTNNSGTLLVDFSGGNLDVVTTTGKAFTATGAGTVRVAGAGNTLATNTVGTGNTVLEVDGLTIGTGGLNFISLNGNGNSSVTKGVFLNNAGGNGLFVVGTGGAGTGGTIQNYTQKGMHINNTNNINLTNVNLSGNGTANLDPAGTCGDNLNGTNTNCAAGIDLQTVTTVNMTGVHVSGGVQQGINGKNVTSMTLTNVEVNNAGNETNESGIQLHNLFGTMTWSGVNSHDNASRQLNIQNSTSTALSLTINTSVGACTFSNTAWPGSATSAQGILFSGTNNAQMTISVQGCTIARNFGPAFQSDSATSADINSTVNGGSLIDNGQHFVIASTGNGNMTYALTNVATMWVDEAHSGVTPISIAMGDGASGVFTGTIQGNTIGQAGDPNSGAPCAGCNIISVRNNGSNNGLNQVTIGGGGAGQGNTLRRSAGGGINVTSGLNVSNDSGSIKVKIIGNTLTEPDGGGTGLPITIVNGTAAADTSDTCANVLNNNISGAGGSGTWNMTAAIRLRHVQNNTVYTLPGYTGLGTDDAAVQTYLDGRNTLNGGASAVTRGAGPGTWGNTSPPGSDCF